MKLPAILLTALFALPSQAQRKPAITVNAQLNVSGKAMSFSGPGQCSHTDDGSIYEAPAAIWSVQQDTNNKSLNLTLFRLKKGGDLFNLSIGDGDANHNVSTVKVGGNGQLNGTGKVSFMPAGAGGSFVLDVTTAAGKKITGKVTCSGFSPTEANG